MNNVDPIAERKVVADEYLGVDASELASRSCLSTAQEIAQQPGVWREAHAAIEAARQEIDAWLLPKLALPRIRVFFSGAGTSAFIGDSIAASLRGRKSNGNAVRFESVNTTDLVANPDEFLSDDVPTILVSFARSGDSPESVACAELASEMLNQCFHLIFTCNPHGRLAAYAKADASALCILMPEGTNDRGFAMTSSYSSMLVSCATIFAPDGNQLERVAAYAEKILRVTLPEIVSEATRPFDRIVVLGAGTLRGTAREAALKCLELAAGKVVSISDTPLGFRHGPKIIVTPSTMVVHLRSMDPHISKYDQDLIDELYADNLAGCIIELSLERLFSGQHEHLDDIWLSLVYTVYCQILAFFRSYSLGIAVDSPCPTGTVNRVVRGVTIHKNRKTES